jgi:PD-(D/E)XK nuclease superfamily
MSVNGSRKLCLELNSHSLSHFQACEKRFYFSEISLLVSKGEYYPFKRGSGIAKYLSYWYSAQKKKYSSEKLRAFEKRLFNRMAKSSEFFNSWKNEDDALHIASRLMGYFSKYREENLPVIAVEKGFSKILYEDSHVLFVYSGRPDLVVDYGTPGPGIGPMDHKSESRENDIFYFNNQFIGYCWAINAHYGQVNYIGLQKDKKDNEVLRRTSFSFTTAQIERWRNDTIEWYHKVLWARRNKKFLRSWNCSGKYGTCLYSSLCTSGSRNEELIKIKRDFRKLDQPYKSW